MRRRARLPSTAMNRALVLVSVVACAHPAPVATCPPTPLAAATPQPAVTSQPAAMVQPPAAAPEPAGPSGYDQPPQYVLDVLHAPSPPQPIVSPTRDTMLLVSWVEVPADRAGRRAVPEARRRARRAADAPQARHAGRLRRRAVRADARGRRRRDARRETPIALPAGGCADGISWAADGKQLRVPQHVARRGRAVDRRRVDRHDAPARRRAAQPDARQLAAVDARPEDAAGEARPRRRRARRPPRRRPPTARASRRPTARRREQHLRGARHAAEQARRGPVRVLRDEPARAGRRRERRGHADRQARRC